MLHYCILLYSIVLCLQLMQMQLCVCACVCMHVRVCMRTCMYVWVIITPKMEWNQFGAHYILTTFPLSLSNLFTKLTALLMATSW